MPVREATEVLVERVRARTDAWRLAWPGPRRSRSGRGHGDGEFPPRPVIFVHIKKAAGRSVEALLAQYYEHPPTYKFNGEVSRVREFRAMPMTKRDRFDLLNGHGYYGLHRYISRVPTYLTLLREPVDRSISHYHHFLSRYPNHQMARFGGSLDDWVRFFDLDNEQVRAISGRTVWNFPHHQLPADSLKVAKHNLEHEFAAFGLSERFEESMELFAPVLGWQEQPAIRINVARSRTARSDISPETERFIRDVNAQDVALYEFASDLFARRRKERATRHLPGATIPPAVEQGMEPAVNLEQPVRPSAGALPAGPWTAGYPPSTNGRHQTVIAATQWRAGSQWMRGIFEQLAPGRTVSGLTAERFLARGVKAGEIHAAVYARKDQIDLLALPAETRIFVVIRDLRDVLVSMYFSVLASHYPAAAHAADRLEMANRSPEDGLLYLLRKGDGSSENDIGARIQRSWLGSDVPILRYEDLIARDVELLVPLLADYCGLPNLREEIGRVVANNRFEVLSGGRSAGSENAADHYRKGEPGDWHNYFSPRVTAEFKGRYGDLLIATGYEQNLDWEADPGRAPANYGEDPSADLARVTQERADILAAYARYTDLFVQRDKEIATLRRK